VLESPLQALLDVVDVDGELEPDYDDVVVLTLRNDMMLSIAHIQFPRTACSKTESEGQVRCTSVVGERMNKLHKINHGIKT
jgi:hypothetical protein